MARIHQPIASWFRAIFLIRNSQSISSIALGERLELEQKLAWKIGRTIRRMRGRSHFCMVSAGGCGR
jgi:hypothetical protein